MNSLADKKNSMHRAMVLFVALPLILSCVPLVSAATDEKSQQPSPVPQATTPARPASPMQSLFDQSSSKVEAVADNLEYQKDSKKLIARGNAVITYGKTKLVSDYAEIETDDKKAYAKGHVLVYESGMLRVQGGEVYYDFGKHAGSFPGGRAISEPWYARGDQMNQVREGVSQVRNGGVTTCNLEEPHYEIRSKKATLYTGDKLLMWNVTIYVLGKPVFWLPFLDVPLNWPNFPIQVTGGYSQQYGTYIELIKGVSFNKYLSGKAHIDWRSRRGFGAGWDQYYEFGKYAKGSIKLYLTQDRKAPRPGGMVDPTTGILNANPYAKSNLEDRMRGRITWRHRSDFDEYTNILMRYHRAADEYFLQDFFEREYRANIQPTSFLTANRNTEKYGAMIYLEKKMNSYEAMVERLPEIRLDWKNQPFLKDIVFNESRVQFDNLSKQLSRSSYHEAVVRTDAYSRWYCPLNWNQINLTSFGGYRGTEYSRQLTTDTSVYRSVVEYGADLRTHFYKINDVSFNKMGIEINQLRHIAEPSIKYVAQQSSLSDYHIAHFDTTDKIDTSQQVIFGLDNRLQTKRVINGKTQRVDVVSFNTYLHFEVSPQDSTIDGSHFTMFQNELVLRPYEWLQYQAHVTYDFYRHYINEYTHDIVIRTGRWRFLFGQRYVHEQYDWYTDQNLQTSQELVFDTQLRLNNLWSVGGYVRYDPKRRTELNYVGEWQVSAKRDLHDFILEFGYNVRDSLIATNNNTFFFTFRLKALPTYVVSAGGNRASFSEPRIGDTVAGADSSVAHESPMNESWYSPRNPRY